MRGKRKAGTEGKRRGLALWLAAALLAGLALPAGGSLPVQAETAPAGEERAVQETEGMDPAGTGSSAASTGEPGAGSQGETVPSGEAGQPGETEPGGSGEGDDILSALTFSIDDSHRYEGMAQSYRDGYLPTVENGRAILILPLLADGEVEGDRLTVVPELGSTESSPFVYRNYQQTVTASRETPLDGGEPVELYLVRLSLELSPDRYNGVYPVGVTVTAKGAGGIPASQTFTTYVTISDGRSTEVPTEAPPAEEEPQSQPLLYVERYTVNPATVEAGQEFTVTAYIRNTSESQSVRNMAIQVAADSDQLTLLEDSSTTYWERLGADTTRELTLRYRAETAIPVGKYHIQLSMTFDNEDAMTLSASGDLAVTVTQPMRVEGEYPLVADSVSAGDTVSLSFQAVNMGKSAAYNVRFELEAPGLMPGGSAYIGNLEAGTAGAAEMRVFVGAKSMNSELLEGEEPYGYSSGVMTLIYEDEAGNEYREEEHFTTNIQELVIGSGEVSAEPEEKGFGQWWLAVGVVALALAGLGAAVWVRRKRAREEEA